MYILSCTMVLLHEHWFHDFAYSSFIRLLLCGSLKVFAQKDMDLYPLSLRNKVALSMDFFKILV